MVMTSGGDGVVNINASGNNSGGATNNKVKQHQQQQQLNSGNYISVGMPMVGAQQQQSQNTRRKYQQQQQQTQQQQITSSDYHQSRIFYNDYMRSDRNRDEFYAIPSPSSQSSDLDQPSQQQQQSMLYTVSRTNSSGSSQQQQQSTVGSYAPSSSLSNVAQPISRGANGSDVDCGLVQNSPGPSTSTNYQVGNSGEIQQSAGLCLTNATANSSGGNTNSNNISSNASNSGSICSSSNNTASTISNNSSSSASNSYGTIANNSSNSNGNTSINNNNGGGGGVGSVIGGQQTASLALHQQQQSIMTSGTSSLAGNQQQQQQLHPQATASSNYGTVSSQSGGSVINSSAASMQRPLQNVIPTCVYLMSRIAVHMEIEGTAQCPAQVMLAAALGCEELGIANKLLAQSIFGLWMTSSLLEIQLKPHHRPYAVRVAWSKLLDKHSHGNEIDKKYDEPMVTLRRNVFFSKQDEEKIKDPRILELLYEEARHNVLMGRYIMEPAHSIMLGGIQARVELGPYNSHTHTISYFRENQSRFLPPHVAKNSSWSWLPVSRKTSAEVRLLEQFKRVPTTATTRKLMRKYLEFCWALPFYGAAFFHGQVEQPVRGLMSLVHHKDIPVLIAINEKGIFIIDPVENTLLLGLKYEELCWDLGKPSSIDDPESMPCIFIQFDAIENGIAVTKLIQVFSRQANMMDALIAHFADQMRRRRDGENGNAAMEHNIHDEPNPIQNSGNGVLSNKLARLTLATFDDEGRCIGQMGSLSITY